MDEVAIYDHPLGSAAVKSHYGFGKIAASSLTRIVLPNGATGVDVAYDVSSDRVSRYTDTHGGVWTVGKPLVYGDENDLRRSVQVRNAYGAPYLYEYDALTGQVLRTGMPTGLAMSEQYEPVPAPARPVTRTRKETAPSRSRVDRCSVCWFRGIRTARCSTPSTA